MSKIPKIKVKVENVDSIIFARDTNIQFQYVYDSFYKQVTKNLTREIAVSTIIYISK